MSQALRVAAVHATTSILTGPIEVPIKTMTDQFVDRANPELSRDLEDAEFAQEALGFAWDAFNKATEAMRDRGAEGRGTSGDAKAREAEAALAVAMRGAARDPLDGGDVALRQ